MQCFEATVSCPGTDNIGVTFGYVGPTVAPTPQGTIVFFSGGSGTTPAAPGEDILSYSDNYVQNFTIIYVAWASAWENASPSGTYPENILLAACRPATLLAWIDGSAVVHSAGAMCAQGKSAGSAAIAYSMSWYGAGKTSAGGYLTNVELLSGPVLSRIDDGCKVPAPTVSMCPSGGICTAGSIAWSRNAGYTPDKTGDFNTWAGINNCAQSGITSSELTTLADMSIVDGVYSGVTANFSFATKRHGWICAGAYTNYYQGTAPEYCPAGNAFCPNNSSPQGYDWYSASTTRDTNLTLTGTNKCDGTTTSSTSTEAEGVDGANALDPDFLDSEKAQIESDMNSACR
jgi:hypothetical protein